MSREIDNQIADRLVFNAILSLDAPRGNKLVCTRRALHSALVAAIREAHDIGFLAGQQDRYGDLTRPGSPRRPAWMDIRLDHPPELARHGILLKPVVLQSLADAGYSCLGDLRWVPEQRLIELRYVGIKTARALRAIVRWLEWEAESASDGGGGPIADP